MNFNVGFMFIAIIVGNNCAIPPVNPLIVQFGLGSSNTVSTKTNKVDDFPQNIVSEGAKQSITDAEAAIPITNVVVDSKSEVNGQIDPQVIRLIKESNLTIGDSNANHKIVLGRASCKCGISSRRIVGGQTAAFREIPWTVALTRNGGGRVYCGGTLINSQYVLTASHCVDGQSAGVITVLINEQEMNSNFEAITQKIAVAKITMHSNYNRQGFDNDIALLRLARAVNIRAL